MSNPGRVPPLVHVPLRYGLMAGGLGFALVITLYYLHRHPFLIPVFFDFRVALLGIFIFFTLKELRDFYFKGVLSFWEGMTASLVLISTFALIATTSIWIFGIAVPSFVTTYVNLFLEQARTFPPEVIQQIGKETFEQNLRELPSTSAMDLAGLYLWQSFVIGLFISVILSVILRRQPQAA